MEQAYHNATTLHPVGLLALLAAVAALFFLPRRYGLFPFLLLMIFVPSAQRVVVGGLDFTLLRLAVLAGLFRVILRREHAHIVNGRLDKIVLIWIVLAIIAYTIQRQSLSALANRLGHAIDTVGVYFLGRCFLRDGRDVRRFFGHLIALSLPLAALFLVERATGRNLFSVFGGVPPVTRERAGSLRVQGAFAHPILAGSFFAALLPVVAYRIKDSKTDNQSVIAQTMILVLLIFLTASSTPILGAVSGTIVLFLLPFRNLFKWIPLATVVGYLALDTAMEAPVWHLVSRIDLTGGSTGWHRYYLIDQTIRNFSQWALVGTSSIDGWGVWANDVTNQYVLEAIRGGFATLLAFAAIIVTATRRVLYLTDRLLSDGHAELGVLVWSLGAMIIAHAVNFIAVSYFGEIVSFFYLGLATIGSMDNYYSAVWGSLRDHEQSAVVMLVPRSITP